MEKTVFEILQARRSEIETKISDLRQELAQIDAAENAIARVPSTVYAPSKQLPTIKEMILDVLAAYPDGARANEIQSGIHVVYGVDIARESLSPQLSRLKDDDNKIDLVGRKWKLLNNINDLI